MGRLVKNVAQASPKALGVDILFAEKDRSSLSTIRQSFQREFGLDLKTSGIPEDMEDNDAYLGAVLAKTNAVGAVLHLFHRTSGNQECLPKPLEVKGRTDLISFPEASGILCNTPKVQAGMVASGFINVGQDEDGSIRRVALLHRFQGRHYPSLPLALFMLTQGVNEAHIEADIFGPLLVVGGARVPINKEGYARLKFSGPAGQHRFIPAHDALRGAFDARSLADKIVILGSSATGLNDLHHTAVSPNFPGTEIFAVLLDNLFENSHYRELPFARGYLAVTTVLAAALVSLLFFRFPPLRAGLGALLVALFFPGIGVILFYTHGLILPAAGPLFSALSQFVLLSIFLYAREQQLAFVRLRQLARVKQLTLESMTAVAESHDELGGAHIKRTQHYVKVLAQHLRATGNYPVLTEYYIELLFHSAPLHDVGKVAVPEHILFKPGPLTQEEFVIMKEHVRRGRTIIETTAEGVKGDQFLSLAAEIAWTHHEKWDGTGYLEGLKGEAIPLSGRIMALADVYDALTSVRHYKGAFSHERAKDILLQGRGTHFDPAIVDAFVAQEAEFQRIARDFKDPEQRLQTK